MTCAHLGHCDRSVSDNRSEESVDAYYRDAGALRQRHPADEARLDSIPGPFRVPLTEMLPDGAYPAQSPESKPSNPKDAISDSKLPMFLVSPFVKMYYAIAMFLGGVKYGYWNYRGVGARASVYLSALDRHLDAYKEGQWYDPVDGTPHLANALACIGIIIDATHSGKLTDDRAPSRTEEYAKVRAEFEALMPKIRAVYADKNPKHYTIDDK